MKSWIEHTEEISTRIRILSELIVEQRCKVVTAPLAHHLALETEDNETNIKADKVDEVRVRKLVILANCFNKRTPLLET